MRDRTSPTRRGKWVSENLLCFNIPAPPPMIPPLDPPSTTAPTTVRERLAQHRSNGTCNACHQYIDPIGFGLEHFDPVGRWRDTDAGLPVDATGNVPGSDAPFDGAVSLAKAIGADPRFLDCVIQKLMTYALGRTLVTMPAAGGNFDDRAGLADLRARVGSSDAPLSTVIELVASSPAMQMRIGEDMP
jgi:hypothetical protein